jgi:hypothetical protein
VSIGEDVFSALTSGSPPLRAYPQLMPQTPVLPALTFALVAGDDDFDLQGPTGLIVRHFRVDAWATTESSAFAQITQAQSLMLASAAFQVNAIRESGAAGYEPDTKLFRESREFTLWANA